MGCMQIGHLDTGSQHVLQRTMCMQGNTIIVLRFVRHMQQASILFLSYFTRIKVLRQSDSILSSFYLLNFYYFIGM